MYICTNTSNYCGVNRPFKVSGTSCKAPGASGAAVMCTRRAASYWNPYLDPKKYVKQLSKTSKKNNPKQPSCHIRSGSRYGWQPAVRCASGKLMSSEPCDAVRHSQQRVSQQPPFMGLYSQTPGPSQPKAPTLAPNPRPLAPEDAEGSLELPLYILS